MEARKRFHEKLDDLYQELIRMGNDTIEFIDRTRKAFANLDFELAQEIIQKDDAIDSYIIRVEKLGVELLARQAPVAIDLRKILAIMWTAQHLERAADNCVNICKALVNLGDHELSSWIRSNIDEMFDRAEKIMVAAMAAFKDLDPKKAAELNKMDEVVDRINRSFLTEYNKESDDEAELVVRVVMISRFLERIADHAVDIGENVKYIITGELKGM